MPDFALEIQKGQADRVFKQVAQHLTDVVHLPYFSFVLGTEVWVVTAKGTPGSEALKVPGVINVEGQAEHVFYDPCVAPSLPGFRNLPVMQERVIGPPPTPAELAKILAPTPNVNVAEHFPLGAPGFFRGKPVTASRARTDRRWARTLYRIGAPQAWQYNKGEGAVIAVLDSGIIPGRLAPGQLIDVWPPNERAIDDRGHGTMVALIAAGRPEVNQGFSGVAPGARLMVLAPDPGEKQVMKTLDIMVANDYVLGFALENKQRVVMNNSWGLFGCDNSRLGCRVIYTRALVAMDRYNAVLCVWAAGNNNLLGCPDVTGFCMNTLPTGIAVGATTLQGQLHRYSSIGGQCYPLTPAVVVPTEGIVPWLNSYKDFGAQGGGTSACAPQVTGAVAILVTEFPYLTNAEVRAALRAGATPLGPNPVFNDGVGSGMLNIPGAIAAAPRAKEHPSYAYEKTFLQSTSTVVR